MNKYPIIEKLRHSSLIAGYDLSTYRDATTHTLLTKKKTADMCTCLPSSGEKPEEKEWA